MSIKQVKAPAETNAPVAESVRNFIQVPQMARLIPAPKTRRAAEEKEALANIDPALQTTVKK